MSAGWASWCSPPVWLSFQLPFFQAFFSFWGIDWFCGQHLSHEIDSIISAGLAEVRVLGLFLFHGLCWTYPFGCVLWSCYCLALHGLSGRWDYVRVKFFWLIRVLRRFHGEHVLILHIGVCLIVLLPAQLLPHQLSLFHALFVICVGLCIFFYLCVQL